MPDEPDISPLSALLELPVQSVVKTDDEYDKLYENRIARLTAMTGQPGAICQAAELAIELTSSCHRLAKSMGRNAVLISQALLPEQRMEEAVAFHTSIVKSLPESDIQHSSETPDQSAEKAYTFFRWMFSPDGQQYPDLTPSDLLNRIFSDETSLERFRIVSIVEILLQRFKLRGVELELNAQFAIIAQIYRGLIYSGVMAISGGELERKELARKLRDLALDASGHFIEGLGILKSLAELINWVDIHRPLEAVIAAQEVERYLSMYSRVLTEWASMALPLNQALRLDDVKLS